MEHASAPAQHEVPSLDALLACASSAARAAGAVASAEAAAAPGGRSGVVRSKASPQDLVTAGDTAAQACVRAAVAAAFPGALEAGAMSFLGEEDVAPGSAESAAALAAALAAAPVVWIVDPIDGTTMYAHGIPTWTVSVGVAVRGRVVAGAVYHPGRDELFAAARGRGATLNGARIHAAPRDTPLGEALFGAGLHNTRHVGATMARAVAALNGVTRGVRGLGSAALHLAYVAAGRLTGFTELRLHPWDLAAGALLVLEAGGRVTDTRGGEYALATADVLATCGSPDVHGGALVVLAAVGADDADAPEAHAAPTPAERALAGWRAARAAEAAAGAGAARREADDEGGAHARGGGGGGGGGGAHVPAGVYPVAVTGVEWVH